MTKGLKPLIHNFVGARGIYPDKYLWNTIPDFVRMATEDDYDPAEYIGFIETNYSMEKQLESIDRVISGSCNKGTLNSQSPDINLAELSNCS